LDEVPSQQRANTKKPILSSLAIASQIGSKIRSPDILPQAN